MHFPPSLHNLTLLPLLLFLSLFSITTLARPQPPTPPSADEINAMCAIPANDPDLLNEERTICISPQPFYPSWASPSRTPLSCQDCANAWFALQKVLAPIIGAEREYLYWFLGKEVPPPPPPPTPGAEHQTPFAMTFGSCTVAIHLIRAIPPRSPDGINRILPERMADPAYYDYLPFTDIARKGEITAASEAAFWCVKHAGGQPGAWFTGQKNGIGVFIWHSDSEVAKEYGTLVELPGEGVVMGGGVGGTASPVSSA